MKISVSGSATGGGGAVDDPCVYRVTDTAGLVDFLNTHLGAVGLGVTPGPGGADTRWVIAFCPSALTGALIVDVYQLGTPPQVGALLEAVRRAAEDPDPPTPIFNPDEADFQVVGQETWLWVDETDYQPLFAQACLPGACVRLDLEPVGLLFAMGNGDEVRCEGPGTPYDSARSYESQQDEPHCGYVYIEDSFSEPDQAFGVTAGVDWKLTWTCVIDGGGSCGGGDLGTAIVTSAPTPLEVREYQAVLVDD